jgi:hypothetical protein
MEPDPIDKIKAGCFDTIGMLVEFTDKRQPFRALLRGRVKDITAKEALTKPLNLRDVAAGSATISGRAAWRNWKRTCRLSAPLSTSGLGSPKYGSPCASDAHRAILCCHPSGRQQTSCQKVSYQPFSGL